MTNTPNSPKELRYRRMLRNRITEAKRVWRTACAVIFDVLPFQRRDSFSHSSLTAILIAIGSFSGLFSWE
jgi:hypothetical protein